MIERPYKRATDSSLASIALEALQASSELGCTNTEDDLSAALYVATALCYEYKVRYEKLMKYIKTAPFAYRNDELHLDEKDV